MAHRARRAQLDWTRPLCRTTTEQSRSIKLGQAQWHPEQAIQCALRDPNQLAPADVLGLQRTIGNRAVRQLLHGGLPSLPDAQPARPSLVIQPKLAVGAAGDCFEQEADRVAREVTGITGASPARSHAGGYDIQRAAATTAGGDLDSELEGAVRRSEGAGAPLPSTVRRALEPRLGADLAAVRVHTDSAAAELSSALGARAFTHKNHIYYGASQSPHDLLLTAHEIVHTIQQGAIAVHRDAAPSPGAPAQPSTHRSPSAGVARAIGHVQGAPIQRMILTIGDIEKEQNVSAMGTWGKLVSGDQDRSFLGDENRLVEQENRLAGVTGEPSHMIRDKWGDRALETKHYYYHPARIAARAVGGGRVGPRRSFQPWPNDMYFNQLGENEDVKIIAHGGGGRVGGYTPVKLLNMLVAMGLDPDRHKGAIWIRGCLAAWRRDGQAGSSFIEILQTEMSNGGFTNNVYGLAGLARSVGGSVFHPNTGMPEPGRVAQEESYDPEKNKAYADLDERIKRLETEKANVRALGLPTADYLARVNAIKAEIADLEERRKAFAPMVGPRTWIKVPGYTPVDGGD